MLSQDLAEPKNIQLLSDEKTFSKSTCSLLHKASHLQCGLESRLVYMMRACVTS